MKIIVIYFFDEKKLLLYAKIWCEWSYNSREEDGEALALLLVEI